MSGRPAEGTGLVPLPSPPSAAAATCTVCAASSGFDVTPGCTLWDVRDQRFWTRESTTSVPVSIDAIDTGVTAAAFPDAARAVHRFVGSNGSIATTTPLDSSST